MIEKTRFEDGPTEVERLRKTAGDLAQRVAMLSRVVVLVLAAQPDGVIEIPLADVMAVDPRTEIVPHYDDAAKVFSVRAATPSTEIAAAVAMAAANEEHT